jgi:hypothetical protein
MPAILGRKDYKQYMPIFRNMDMPPAPVPSIHNLEAPLAGRRRRGKSIDVETGDLILEEAHQQEYWVVNRNMMGDIIDLYRVETDDEIH